MKRSDITVNKTYKSAKGTIRRVEKIRTLGADSEGYIFDVYYTLAGRKKTEVTTESNFAKWAKEEVTE
jgi:hypothetical protein